MRLVTLFLFLIYSYGLGFAFTRFLKKCTFEVLILRIGVGLAALPVAGIFLNAFHIPLDWRIFFALTFSYPAICALKEKSHNPKGRKVFSLPRTLSRSQMVRVGVILLFFLNVWIYCHGAFTYPYLEDDDSWTHAVGIKYIALEKNINVPPGVFHYINPYPPGYDLTLALLHQTSPSLYWTMKFMNAFFVSLSFLFFYLFARELSSKRSIALTAMFVLSCLPCYLSHFIWAHSLAVTLFFPAFICIKKSFDNKKFILPGAVSVAGIFLTQPTQSIKFVIMALLLILAFTIIYRKIPFNAFIILLIALMLSLVWFGPVANDMLKGDSHLAARTARDPSYSVETKSVVPNLFKPASGSATQRYTLKDYLVISEYNYVNNPIGLGFTISLLGALGVFIHFIYLLVPRRANPNLKFYSLTVLFWLTFTFLGTNSQTFNLPVGLFAFRFWMLFAIPVALLVADAVLWMAGIFRVPRIRNLFLCGMLFLIMITTGRYKHKVNTSWWTYGVYWTTVDEVKAFVWMREHFPVNTKVFEPLDNFFVLGHDMLCKPWTKEYKENFSNVAELSLDDLYPRLTRLGYEYILIGPREIRLYGPERLTEFFNALMDDPRFRPIYEKGRDVRIFKLIHD